jgi:hypothetical protein
MMTILQLNPTIPVVVDVHNDDNWKGGYAIALIDYSQEHHIMFVVALDEDGSVWTVENPRVRLQRNISLGRT